MAATLKTTVIQEPSSGTVNMTLGSTGGVTFGSSITSNTITSAASTALTIQSAGTTAMTIDTSQNVGIGTTSPTAYGTHKTLAINGAAGVVLDMLYNGTRTGSIVTESADVNILNITSGPLRFSTNATEAMRIDSSGNLLVGVTSGSNTKFRVQGADTSSSNYTAYFQDSAASNLFLVRNDGYISTGTSTFSPYNTTTASAANLFVGNTGGLARSTSSIRYKTDVQDATHGLADVMKLRSVTYKGKNDGDKLFGGFIAEEVDAAGLNEFVVYDAENKPDALHYGNMVALMAKALQELSAKVDAQAAEITALQAKVGA